MIEGPRLAALVASRVCHDMAEPMNALIQGLEMLKESDTAGRNGDAIALMEHGVAKAWAKLEFFRFAFAGGGAAGGDGDGRLEEARAVAEKLYGALKPALEWRAPAVSMPRATLKVFMNALFIANECLPKGGVVTVDAGAADGGAEIRLGCTGQRANVRAATWAALQGDLPEDGYPGPVAQPLLTGILARQTNVDILTRQGEGSVEIILRSPAFALA
ncbi:MAG: histidine phosphotransferase family protein [Hyphomonadaceae bacterium]|nr:histidine phosphotransferase family protein [Hyphomonadaceae bacterium]